MIVCPGCLVIAEPGTYPSVSMAGDEDSPGPVPWWCPVCLSLNLILAHAALDDCRCIGHPA